MPFVCKDVNLGRYAVTPELDGQVLALRDGD
jgi:hypothetical protein